MSQDQYEPVLVEHDWYDGPRSGLAYVAGTASYFRCLHGYSRPGEPDGVFRVWPATDLAITWELEQWDMFTDWHQAYASGGATLTSHPGRGGVNHRYDYLESLLAPYRKPPPSAPRYRAQWRFKESAQRYHPEGLDYEGLWTPVHSPSANGSYGAHTA